MFRRIEDLEGGPGDPKDIGEWWANFRKMGKNVLLPLAIAVIVVLALAAVAGTVMRGIG